MSDDEKPYEEPPIEWPESTRALFECAPGKLNMRVEWMLRSPAALDHYADGYREAAEALYQHAAESSHVTDALLFPFAFLWRQHLELALKVIIRLGNEAAGKTAAPLGHILGRLWNDAEPFIIATGPKGDVTHLIVKDRVVAFENLDRLSDGFRYPTTSKGAPSLATAPTHINMSILHDVMLETANFLSGVTSQLIADIDALNEDP